MEQKPLYFRLWRRKDFKPAIEAMPFIK